MNNELVIKYYDDYLDSKKQFVVETNKLVSTSYMHNHQFVEVELLISGSGVHILNGTSLKIEPGFAVIMAPSDFHSYLLTDNTDLEILSLKFNADLLSDDIKKMFISRKVPVSIQMPDEQKAEIMRISEIITEKSNAKDRFANITARNCIEYVCTLILEEHEKVHGFSRDDIIDDKCQKALSYIHLNFRKKLSLDDVAAYIHMTPTYFCTYFKQQTGSSFITYTNKLRVQLAYDLITHTDITLTQIYYESGFKSYTHFSKIFKEFYGHPPGYFRER
jgi:AraC-type DNA-binding domain-containing proteins